MELRASLDMPTTQILLLREGEIFVGIDEAIHTPVIDLLPATDGDRDILIRLLGEMRRKRAVPQMHLWKSGVMIILQLMQPAAPVRRFIQSLMPVCKTGTSPTEIMIIADAPSPPQAATMFAEQFTRTGHYILSVVANKDSQAPLWRGEVGSYRSTPPPITIVA